MANGIKEKFGTRWTPSKKGQALFFREFNLIDALSITENIFYRQALKIEGDVDRLEGGQPKSCGI